MADTGIYVYGLVAADALTTAPAVAGIDGCHSVELLRHGGVCALISRVDLEQFDEQPLRAHLSDMAWVERTAQGHQRVLDAVLGECTPLPMRMCTVYSGQDGLRAMLVRDGDVLRAGLSELDGRLEWGVKAFALPASAGHRGIQAAPVPAAATGAAYLQTRLAQRTAGAQQLADLEEACDHVHRELCMIAASARLSAPQRPEVSGRDQAMVMNASYLVANARRADFCRRVQAMRDETATRGLELALTGPWPPYNFVPAAIGGGV